MEDSTNNFDKNHLTDTAATIALQVHPERRFLQRQGSSLHIHFLVRVTSSPVSKTVDRAALNLALVLDRSGSMQGEKIKTAKKAALSVIDRLDEHDSAAIIVFDDRIDVIQPVAPVTKDFKAAARKALSSIEARGATALHTGWLTGCNTIVADNIPAGEHKLSRCFLLTDGLANRGITDCEQIATEAAGIRDHAGIATSTFGIGSDYDESLLGPMAVAGGGQFHHLRTPDEITNTFTGELGNMFSVVVSQVRLEFEGEEGMSIDTVSAYWTNPTGKAAWSIAIGDLCSAEERPLVVRLAIPAQQKQETRQIRARLVWVEENVEKHSDWQTVQFLYAEQATYDAETPIRDPQVMHWVGLHHASRARRQAVELNQRGQRQEASELIQKVAQHILKYAGNDTELLAEVKSLLSLQSQVAMSPMAPGMAKEVYYSSQSSVRKQTDYRSSQPPQPPDEKKKK